MRQKRLVLKKTADWSINIWTDIDFGQGRECHDHEPFGEEITETVAELESCCENFYQMPLLLDKPRILTKLYEEALRQGITNSVATCTVLVEWGINFISRWDRKRM